MVLEVDECCDCGLPCMGDICPNRHIKRYYCDNCNEEANKLYYGANGRELCGDCALEELEVVE